MEDVVAYPQPHSLKTCGHPKAFTSTTNLEKCDVKTNFEGQETHFRLPYSVQWTATKPRDPLIMEQLV